MGYFDVSEAILEWLGGNDTGASSKVIALTALGKVPGSAEHNYPRDGADFGRCHRLIAKAPEAKAALPVLAEQGGPYWAALIARWDEVEAAYLADVDRPRGERGQSYDLMRSIFDPIAKADPRVVSFGPGISMVLPK